MSNVSLETERLIIRTLTLNDVQSFFNYRSLGEVARFQTFIPKNLSDAITFIDITSSEMNVPNSWYQLGLFDKRNNKHIGDIGIPEDPVTGSAHCILIPYWAKRLSKKQLHARQVSKRGGELLCEDREDRVIITGKAVLQFEGAITL